MILYIIYRMTPISVICHFYVPPDTPIISLPLGKGNTAEALPPKGGGFYLKLGE